MRSKTSILLALTVLAMLWRVAGSLDMQGRGVIGIDQNDDEITLVKEGFPAAAAGVLTGDRVVVVEDGGKSPRAGDPVIYTVEREGAELKFEMVAVPLPGSIRAVMLGGAAMGLVFLSCGWFAFLRVGHGASWLFALYGLAEFVHWGGYPSPGSESLQNAVWTVLFLSTMCAASLFLHFTLVFPEPWPSASSRKIRVALYGPPVVGLLLGLAMMVRLAEQALLIAFALLQNLQAYLYTIIALIVVIVRLRRMSSLERGSSGLRLLLWTYLAATVPYLTVMIVEAAAPTVSIPGGGSFPYTLLFTLIPLSVATAIIRNERSQVRPDP